MKHNFCLKRITILAFFVLATTLYAFKDYQTGAHQFEVSGTLPIKDGIVVSLMQDPYGKMITLTSDTIRNGKFHLRCPVKEIMPVSVVYSEGKRRYSYTVIMENAHIQFHLRNTGQEEVSGGNYNKRLFAYQHDSGYLHIDDESFKEKKTPGNKTDTDKQWRLIQYFMKKNKIRSNYLLKVMNDKRNPRMAVIAALLLQLQPDRTKAMAIVNAAALQMGEQSFIIQKVRQMNETQQKLIDSRKGNMIGEKYIDFTVNDSNGDRVQLASLVAKHKYTLLQFWASWCVPCRAETPELKNIYNAMHNKGLAIISFSMDNNRTSWIKATEKDAFDWPSTSDLLAQQSPIIKEYSITSIPANVIIAQDGTIVASNLGGDELKEKLEELFK